ncbi:unnamed protein product [Dimorphilus gyrociliatus]|uniref:Uncharacterized protein n=1 Tax=Dimorphilus gyrociliatus TaxID=2664684 RepID=A0A7I8W5M2_9ANNE|nr:unnamed protein product [Dimorphilus gyrociliatus]
MGKQFQNVKVNSTLPNKLLRIDLLNQPFREAVQANNSLMIDNVTQTFSDGKNDQDCLKLEKYSDSYSEKTSVESKLIVLPLKLHNNEDMGEVEKTKNITHVISFTQSELNDIEHCDKSVQTFDNDILTNDSTAVNMKKMNAHSNDNENYFRMKISILEEKLNETLLTNNDAKSPRFVGEQLDKSCNLYNYQYNRTNTLKSAKNDEKYEKNQKILQGNISSKCSHLGVGTKGKYSIKTTLISFVYQIKADRIQSNEGKSLQRHFSKNYTVIVATERENYFVTCLDSKSNDENISQKPAIIEPRIKRPIIEALLQPFDFFKIDDELPLNKDSSFIKSFQSESDREDNDLLNLLMSPLSTPNKLFTSKLDQPMYNLNTNKWKVKEEIKAENIYLDLKITHEYLHRKLNILLSPLETALLINLNDYLPILTTVTLTEQSIIEILLSPLETSFPLGFFNFKTKISTIPITVDWDELNSKDTNFTTFLKSDKINENLPNYSDEQSESDCSLSHEEIIHCTHMVYCCCCCCCPCYHNNTLRSRKIISNDSDTHLQTDQREP